MPKMIRFHLDEHCDPAIALGLRRRGVDLTTTYEAGLLGADDLAHLAYCNTSCRVVFTQDEDFLSLHAAGVEHQDIAYCRQRTRGIGEIVAGLLPIREVYEAQEMSNRVEFL